MAEPISTSSAGGFALFKYFGGAVAFSGIGVTLGFLFMWPKTMREAAIRIACTMLVSMGFGPFLVIALHAQWPALFASARAMAVSLDAPAKLGMLFVGGPIMAATGLPAWWVVGAIVRWFDKRKKQDIGEMVHDARLLMFPRRK